MSCASHHFAFLSSHNRKAFYAKLSLFLFDLSCYGFNYIEINTSLSILILHELPFS